jgi:hypothetical protein
MTIAPGTFYTPAVRMAREEAEAKWGVGVPNPRGMGRPAEYGAECLRRNDFSQLKNNAHIVGSGGFHGIA